MTIEEIRRRKKELGYTNAQVAEKAGLPLATVQKVLGGITRSPRYTTVQALAAALSEKTVSEPPAFDEKLPLSPSMVQEAPAAYAVKNNSVRKPEEKTLRYPRQGSYTIEDVLALPDDQRVELIDGVIYDMSAPTTPHQLLGGEIYALLREYLRDKKGKCIPFVSPVDVQLDKDNRTMVQPDVCVVCDHSKINRLRIYGAPDFVVEVLSPSTKMKDILVKLRKYQKAGIREYWMVDPDKKATIKVLFMPPSEKYPDGNMDMEIFPFSKPVPVGIFHDECFIDFAEIMQRYAFLFED